MKHLVTMLDLRRGRAAALGLAAALTTWTAGAESPTTPIKSSDVRSVSTSPAWTGPSDVHGIDRVKHLSDGVAFSSWAGDPSQEPVAITWHFAGTRYVSQLDLTPGCAGSNRTFGEFSRPRKVTVSAGDRTETLTLGDRRRGQVFTFDPPLRARDLKLEVATTYRGKRAGVCFTEVTFREQNALIGVSEATRDTIDRHVAALGTDTAPQAILALEAIGPAAVPGLTHALAKTNFDVQRDALEAFRRLGTPAGADTLLKYWKSGPDSELVPLALGALASTGSNAALKVIVSLMTSNDFDLADAAADASGAFGPSVVPSLARLLRSEHDDVVERSLRALSKISSPDVVPLAAPYVKARFSTWRTAAAKALAASGSVAALPYLRTLANDPHPSVRLAIASFAERFPPGEAQTLLSRLLRDDDDAVARRSLHTLAASDDGIRHLADYLRDDYAPLGNEAVELLAQSKSRLALRVMIDALARGEARFRNALRDGVEAFGSTGVTAIFEAAQKDQRLKVDARMLLVKFPNLAQQLISPLLTRNPTEADISLIETLGQARPVGSLRTLDYVFAAGAMSAKVAVVKAWAHYPSAAVSGRVLQAMRMGDPMIRREAAIAASRAGVKEVAPLLVQALADGTIAPETVVTALGRLRDTSAEKYMLERFKDSDASMAMRLAVLQACRQLQTPQCLRTLYSATNDANLTVRHEALLLLNGDEDRLAKL